MAAVASYSAFGILLICYVVSVRTSVLPDTLDVDSDKISSNTSCEDVHRVFLDNNIGLMKDTTDMSHEGMFFFYLRVIIL